MTTTEAIIRHLGNLPERARQEVLDFVEFLSSRRPRSALKDEDGAWSEFSLASAMRGMEAEDSPYTLTDLKEPFK